MISGIVQKDNPNFTFIQRKRFDLGEELPGRFGVECTIQSAVDETAAADVHRPEVTERFPVGLHESYRLLHSWRDPHVAGRSVELEKCPIHRPDPNI